MMNLSSKVNFLLGLHTQLKINHWQTKGLGRHLAFGDTYSKLTDLIDNFVGSKIKEPQVKESIVGEPTKKTSSGNQVLQADAIGVTNSGGQLT